MRILGLAVASVLVFSMVGCSGDEEPEASPTPAGIVTPEQSENPFAGSEEDWQQSLEDNREQVSSSLEAIDPELERRADDLVVICGWVKKGINGTALVDKVRREFKPASDDEGKARSKARPISEQEASEIVRSSLQYVCPM